MHVARSLWHLTAAVAGRVARHSQMARASQFAYVSFVASIPFAFVLISVIGLVASPQSYSTLVDNTRGTVPDQLADFLDGLLQAASSSAGQSILFLVLGLITGVWLAGNVAGSLMDGLDDAFERPHRPWLKGKARALSLAIATALVVVLTTILAVFGPGVLQWVVERVGAPAPRGVTARADNSGQPHHPRRLLIRSPRPMPASGLDRGGRGRVAVHRIPAGERPRRGAGDVSLHHIATSVRCFLCHGPAGPRCRMVNDRGLLFIACHRCAKQNPAKTRQQLNEQGATT